MGFLGYLFSLLITGLVIGGLGRLVVPGPNPMSLGMTFGIGIGGAFIGGILGALIGLGFVSIVLEVAIAAGLVVLVSRRGGQLTR
jgi:uncharacterized membrane protein YeaQ/YmgE (transglycosylase-associated protein family)